MKWIMVGRISVGSILGFGKAVRMGRKGEMYKRMCGKHSYAGVLRAPNTLAKFGTNG